MLLLTYFIPMLLGIFLCYKLYSDEDFSDAVGVNTYASLGIFIVLTLIPIINLIFAVVFLIIAMMEGAFNSNNIHPRKGK